MKRTIAFAILCLSFLPALAHADSLDDMIKASEQELQTRLQKRNDMTEQWKGLDQKKSDIEFAYDAAQKQEAKLTTEITDWKMRKDTLASKYAALEPELQAHNSRVANHNAHQCTEKCTQNGGCDGSCAWYNNEKAQLDAEGQALASRYAPLDNEQAGLKSEAQTLEKNADLIQQIKQNVSNDVVAWVANVKQFKANWEDNEAQIKLLQDNIAKLKVIQAKTTTCFRAIPPECDRPDNPNLNARCEQMVAQCRAIFDGSRP